MGRLVALRHRHVGHGELIDRLVVLDNGAALAIRDRVPVAADRFRAKVSVDSDDASSSTATCTVRAV